MSAAMRLFVLLVSAFLTALSGNAALARSADGARVSASPVEAIALREGPRQTVARPDQPLAKRVERWALLPRIPAPVSGSPLFEQRLRI